MLKKWLCGALAVLAVATVGNGRIEAYAFAANLETKEVQSLSDVGASFSFSGVKLSKTSGVKSGDTITVSPVVSGDSGVTYKFVWGRDNWTDWKIVKDFSATKQVSVQVGKAGKYEFYIDAKDKNGKVITKSVAITVTPSFDATGISGAASVVAGNKVTLKPTVSGTATGLKYKFVWEMNNWNPWGVAQQYGTNSTYNFVASRPGTYNVFIDVKDKWGNVDTVSKAVTVQKPYTVKGINLGNIYLGQTAKISAMMSGNVDGLTYKFVWGQNNWAKWGILKDFNATSNTSFKPTAAGVYDIYMDVKDKYGNVTSISKKLTVTNTLTVNAPTVSNTKVGVPVTVKANASSTVGGLQYKFVWEKDNWKHWGILGAQGFSSASSATFTPTAGHGTYNIYTDVKDSSGNVVTKSKAITVSNYNAAVGVNVTSVDSGQPVKITVSGTPSVAKLKYVACYDNWKNWEIIAENTTNNTITYYPKYTGNLTIYVDVKYYVTSTFTSKSIKVSQGAQIVPEFLTLVNAERAKQGLHAYRWDSSIDAAVMVRAKELDTLFSHTRPDGSSCFTAGNFYGEIIAGGQGSPQRAVQAWMNSPGHHALIMDKDFTSMSGAKFKNYWIICFSFK